MTTTSASRHRTRGLLRRAVSGPAGRTTLTLAVVVAIFAGLLPRIGDYAEAWLLLRSLTRPEVMAVVALGALNLATFAPLWMVALPGLTFWRALTADSVSTAISNTAPVGFAFGVGTTAALFHSFGFAAGTIARAIALTGIWNSLVKLAMPAVALSGLVLVGDATPAMTIAAVLGSVILLLVVTAMVASLTHREAAALLAGTAQRLARRTARLRGRVGPTDWVARADRFRIDSLELLRHRWVGLTLAAVVSHAAFFLVFLACLRTVDGAGAGLHWVVVLTIFSVTRLVTIVPITPGALGVAELSYVAGLTAVGVGAGAAAGAVLLFRFLTWFVPIPLGTAAWLLWRRGIGRTPSPVPPRRTEAR